MNQGAATTLYEEVTKMLWIEGKGYVTRSFTTSDQGRAYVLTVDGTTVVLLDSVKVFSCKKGEYVHFGGYGQIKVRSDGSPTVYLYLAKGGFVNPSLLLKQAST